MRKRKSLTVDPKSLTATAGKSLTVDPKSLTVQKYPTKKRRVRTKKASRQTLTVETCLTVGTKSLKQSPKSISQKIIEEALFLFYDSQPEKSQLLINIFNIILYFLVARTHAPTRVGENSTKIVDKMKKRVRRKKKPSEYHKDDIEYMLASLLFSKIKQHYTMYKKPDMQKWAREIDLMIRIDKISPVMIEQIIEWAQANDFWYKNILSTRKLRDKFDTLYLHKQAEENDSRRARHQRYKEKRADIVDKFPETTTYLVRSFIREFCTDDTVFDSSSYQWPNFVRAAGQANAFASRINNKHINANKIVDYLMKCLHKHHHDVGATIYAGTVCSDTIWQIVFPQYLCRQMPSLAAFFIRTKTSG